MKRQFRLHGQQHGATTLLAVMLLFGVMAMMTIYANRNLLFELRIANNHYRAGVAMEAADGGIEWSLGMLNGIHVDAACQASGVTGSSFRQRYLAIDASSGMISPNQVAETVAGCIRQDAWVCSCPATRWIAPFVATEQLQPGFRISFEPVDRAGVIRIVSQGCSSSSATECDNPSSAVDAALATDKVLLSAALVSALKMPPTMPLVVKGSVALGPEGLGLHNSSGLLLLSGGMASGLLESRLDSLPGTPVELALITGNTEFAAKSADEMFAMYFGMAPARYRDQPAMRMVECPADCGPELSAAYAKGVELAWIDRPITMTNSLLGQASHPMLIVVNGDLTIDGDLQMTGLLYVRGNLIWRNAQTSLLNGGLLVEGNLRLAGTVDIQYAKPVIELLNKQAGSFVRVPGSWWN